jgi:hypothetical protein
VTGLPTLDPEIADLGVAIGLLTDSGSGVQLDSSWFDAPADRLSGALADDSRRNALVRFADAVLDDGTHTERAGVTFVQLFDLRTLTGDSTLPDLTIQLSLDARPAAYVEVGLAATFVTTVPATTTDVVMPLYRAAKTGQVVGQPFALLDGGVVSVSTDLTLDTTTPAVDAFGLQGVSAAVETALTGGPQPSFRLVLKGLHLPGATTSPDLELGGPDTSLEDALLSLILGLVRQGVDSLAGAAAAQVNAVLDLAGLGDAAGIPPLPVAELAGQGVAALRDWFVQLLGSDPARAAWLHAIGQLFGVDSSAADHVDLPIGTGPVRARLTLATATGASGHLILTPRLGLVIATPIAADEIELGVEANADLFTLDVATGAFTAVPSAEVVVTATGTGTDAAAKLVHTPVADIGTLRLGLEILAGTPRALINLLDVDVQGHHFDLLDLSTPDAAAAAAGDLAAGLLRSALLALGAAGESLAALLGLSPPADVTAIDGARLLTDPFGTLARWWSDLTAPPGPHVPDVLTHLRDLIIGPAGFAAADQVTGHGLPDDPWSIPVLTRLSIDCWRDGTALHIAPTLSLRGGGDLAGGCTTVQTQLRLTVFTVDLAGPHADFPLAVDLLAKVRGTGTTDARLTLGPVAIVADFVGVQARWSPHDGFAVDFLSPELAIDAGTRRIPLVLPTVDAAGHVDVPPAAWTSVESLIGVLAAGRAHGWLADLVELTGWTFDEVDAPLLPLVDLAADPVGALRAWLGALATDPDRLRTLTGTLAHFFGGSARGMTGGFAGSGTPSDPWLAGLGTSGSLPCLAVWLGPDGPVTAASRAPGVVQTWRPGMPGVGNDALVAAIVAESGAGADAADLLAGRPTIRTGLDALAGRWVGTDGRVAPPPTPVPGLRVDTLPDVSWPALAAEPIERHVATPLTLDAVIVRVAVGPVAQLPWTAPAGRVIDLTTPGIAPTSFTVGQPATGEWFIALSPRADATLGGATDPTGVVGQAARLQQVLGPLATHGPVTLVAYGGAGHAARLAADAVSRVEHLVTLGTPWSAATFDSARTGIPADTLRLLSALLPALEESEPDDDDLARGRALVDGFMDAARGRLARRVGRRRRVRGARRRSRRPGPHRGRRGRTGHPRACPGTGGVEPADGRVRGCAGPLRSGYPTGRPRDHVLGVRSAHLRLGRPGGPHGVPSAVDPRRRRGRQHRRLAGRRAWYVAGRRCAPDRAPPGPGRRRDRAARAAVAGTDGAGGGCCARRRVERAGDRATGPRDRLDRDPAVAPGGACGARGSHATTDRDERRQPGHRAARPVARGRGDRRRRCAGAGRA